MPVSSEQLKTNAKICAVLAVCLKVCIANWIIKYVMQNLLSYVGYIFAFTVRQKNNNN